MSNMIEVHGSRCESARKSHMPNEITSKIGEGMIHHWTIPQSGAQRGVLGNKMVD